MAFWQEVSDEQLNRDHRSNILGGTDMAVLMGHGYLEKNESYLDAIMRIWERKRGLGTRTFKDNDAMRTGIEQEPVAYNRLKAALERGALDTYDERYSSARIYEPFRGMRIQEGDDDGYGIGGNMDAPLFDVSGEYDDPVTGAAISGEDYARRYAEEHAKILMQKEVNKARELDGEEPWPVSEAKYKAPPFIGVIDIKVTQSSSVLFDRLHNGVPPGWVVQTHHYRRVLEKKSRELGFLDEHDPKLLGIYQMCLENNKRYYHELEYDPELNAEMQRREQLFVEKCLKQGIPPNSSELRGEFYIYPLKGTEPTAVLPDADTEKKLKSLLEKHKGIKQRQKTLKEYEASILQDLAAGVRLVNGVADEHEGKEMAGVFVDESIVEYGQKITNRRVTNEAAVNGTLLAAGEARFALEVIKAALGGKELDADEKLTAISEAVHSMDTERLPREGVQIQDYQSVQRDKADTSSVSIRNNKNTRYSYQKLIDKRGLDAKRMVGVEDPGTGNRTQPEQAAINYTKDAQKEPADAVMVGQHTAADSAPQHHEDFQPLEGPVATEKSAEGQWQPPAPVQFIDKPHESQAVPIESLTKPAAVSEEPALEETPLNDDLELKKLDGIPESEREEGAQNLDVTGLGSKPAQEGASGKGPDLLGGAVPADLLEQVLPEDLFAPKTDSETELGVGAVNTPPGLVASPF